VFYAVTEAGPHVAATPSAAGSCPLCGRPVLARCGQVNAWHWAHQTGGDCDVWSEPTTDWHRAYQRVVPPERCEVRYGQHRADLVSPDGLVLELQHSSISAADIAAREAHYDRMMWLFDARKAYGEQRLTLRRGNNDSYVTFRWKQARRSVLSCSRPVMLDLGTGLVLLTRKLYAGPPFAGWGQLLDLVAVWQWLRTGAAPKALTWQQYDQRILAETIDRVSTFIGADPTATDADIARLVKACMFAGTRFPPKISAALLALASQGKCPSELAAHACAPARWTSHAGIRILTVDCPCGAEHQYQPAAGQQRWPDSFSTTCGTQTYTVQIPTAAELA
jgi:competence protein CoiA